jgi:hypothetical protein
MSDWQPISDLPRTDMPVLVYFSARVWLDALGNEVSFGSARDYVEKIDIGFFKGSCWHESGTGTICLRVGAKSPTCQLTGCRYPPRRAVTHDRPPRNRNRRAGVHRRVYRNLVAGGGGVVSALARLAGHPLRACGCGNAHDQSASCRSVALAKRIGERRAHLTELLCRKSAEPINGRMG